MFWSIHLFNICTILSLNKFSLPQLNSCIIITILVIYHFSSINETCNSRHTNANLLLERHMECQDVYSTLERSSTFCPQKHFRGHTNANILIERCMECQDVYGTLERSSTYCPQKHFRCLSI